MTEERTPYGKPYRFKTIAHYHLYRAGEITIDHTGELTLEARDAIEAGRLALATLERMTSPAATVVNVQLFVSLEVDE